MSAKRKTILITGGAGYIGSHVALCCILSGLYKIVAIDNLTNAYRESLRRVTSIALDTLPANASAQDKADCQVNFVRGDITSRQDLEDLFGSYAGKGGIFGVIHLAALKAVGESGELPLEYYKTNVGGTAFLLEAMEKFGTKHFIYSSSATVYGAPTVSPISESTPLQPKSAYGRTKFMCELIIKDAAVADRGLRAISLRYFNPAGSHPTGKMGESPRGKPGNLLPLLAQLAVGKYQDEGLQVFGNDDPTRDGTCVRDYIHVMDLAQGHVDALTALEDEKTFAPAPSFAATSFGGSGGHFKAYNLGNEATGFDYQYEVVDRRLGDVPNLTADPSLAHKELKFESLRTLEEMCRDLWNWQKQNPDGYTDDE